MQGCREKPTNIVKSDSDLKELCLCVILSGKRSMKIFKKLEHGQRDVAGSVAQLREFRVQDPVLEARRVLILECLENHLRSNWRIVTRENRMVGIGDSYSW